MFTLPTTETYTDTDWKWLVWNCVEVFTLQRDIPTQIPLCSVSILSILVYASRSLSVSVKAVLQWRDPEMGLTSSESSLLARKQYKHYLELLSGNFKQMRKLECIPVGCCVPPARWLYPVLSDLGGGCPTPLYQACENITLPQTSFAGSNYDNYVIFL